MEALKKLNQARINIKQNNIEKKGWNDFSKYKYYTPEQIDKLVSDANKTLNLFAKFDLIRNEFGLHGRLQIIDLDSGKDLIFEMATDIPEIKATNIAQQLGGAVTYTERYLKMTAYEIVDNTIDPDTPQKKSVEKKQATDDKKWLNPNTKQWENAVDHLKKTSDMDSIDAIYKISKVNRELLIKESN